MITTLENTYNLRFTGNPNAEVLVVCDAPTKVVFDGWSVMSQSDMNLVGGYCEKFGIPFDAFAFLTPCPPIPATAEGSESREAAFIREHQPEFTEFCNLLQNVKLIVSFGAVAAKQAMSGPVKISKIRGQIVHTAHRTVPVLPMFSPRHVIRRPEVLDFFESDVRTLAELYHNGFDFDAASSAKRSGKYEWLLDLSSVLAIKDASIEAHGYWGISLDTEYKGSPWYRGALPLIGQISWTKGESVCFPLDVDYWNSHCAAVNLPPIDGRTRSRIKAQLKLITEDPRVYIVGHALNADRHVLRNIGVEVANHDTDSMQLAFVVDENMLLKSLDECTRRWIPQMAGYADEFNNDPVHDHKQHMERVPLDKMIEYAGGDTDADLRVAHFLTDEGMRDARNWNCYRAVHMPAIRAFFEVERQGLKVDTAQLSDLYDVLFAREQELYASLIKGVPQVLLNKHAEKGLNFGRPEFLMDILFTEDGFGLTPIVFTEGTRKLPPEQRVPSTSAKDHLPFFTEECPWVVEYTEYTKIQKMITTYVGQPASDEVVVSGRRKRGFDAEWENEQPVIEQDGDKWNYRQRVPKDLERCGGVSVGQTEFKKQIYYTISDGVPPDVEAVSAHLERWRTIVYAKRREQGILLEKHNPATGFWQYLSDQSKIHPSYFLHRTNTGRTASAGPNAQNFPKRGKLAKAYRKIFIPDPGWSFVAGDLSQAELRVAAWMADEQEMLRIYRDGGDIHEETAAATMGISTEKFRQMHEDEIDKKRTQAKAVNFGFLYGMGWTKFKTYAKTDYNLNFTDSEAKAMRNAFFAKYPRLESWHVATREFVREHGYVRALHGALRRLPNIASPDEKVRADCERQAINAPVQRFSSDLGLMGMTRFSRDCDHSRMHPVAFIHDAVVLHVKNEYVEEAASALKFYMQSPPFHWFSKNAFGDPLECPIPIVSDIEVGDKNMGEMAKRKDVKAVAPSWYRHDLDLYAPV